MSVTRSAEPLGARRGLASVAATVALTVVVAAIAVPALAVAAQALRGDSLTEAATRILGSARTWRIVAATIGQAGASTALTVAVGLPVAWVLARFRFRGRGALMVLVTVPFVLPSVVIGAAFASLLGPSGMVDLRGTWWPILAAHVCFNTAVVVRTMVAAFDASTVELEAAARTLGCTPVRAVTRAVLPAVATSLIAAATIVFLFCLTSFGVIVMLGGGSVTTLEVELWTRATRQFDLPGAGVLALVQLVAVIAAVGVQRRVGARSGSTVTPQDDSRRRTVRTLGAALAVAATTVVVSMVSVAPIAALFARSLGYPREWTLRHWQNLGSVTDGTGLRVSPLDAIWVSLRSTVLAASIAVLLAVVIVRRLSSRPARFSETAVLLPLGVSSTTLGLGLLLVAGRPPLDLRSAVWLVPLAQALVALPVVVRTLLPAHRGVPPALLEAAATLGANERRRWWSVELPLLVPALGAATGLAVLVCLGEFGATVFIARTSSPTVPVAIERLMSRPGGEGFGQAMALSCVLVGVCAALVAVIGWGSARMQRRGSGPTLTL